MDEIVKLIALNNLKRKVLHEYEIKKICEIIIKTKKYQYLVDKVKFKSDYDSSNDERESVAGLYDGNNLYFYKKGLSLLEKLADEIDVFDGSRVDKINFCILETIFHEFAHVRQLSMMNSYSGSEAKLYRICNELGTKDDFYEKNYTIMLEEINAFTLGIINACRIYESLPKNIISMNDRNAYKCFTIEKLLSNYLVVLKKDLIISPSDRLLVNISRDETLKNKYYDKMKNLVDSCHDFSLYRKLTVGLPISFEEYAYANMFLTNNYVNVPFTFVKKFQNHK